MTQKAKITVTFDVTVKNEISTELLKDFIEVLLMSKQDTWGAGGSVYYDRRISSIVALMVRSNGEKVKYEAKT